MDPYDLDPAHQKTPAFKLFIQAAPSNTAYHRPTPQRWQWVAMGVLLLCSTLSLQVLATTSRTSFDVITSGSGQAALNTVQTRFEQVGITFPPAQITLLATKNTRTLEVWAANEHGPFKYVHRYRILGASGDLGPKLNQGDRQVPEGIYQIEALNPNSAYHLSLRLNYPNAFDRKMAEQDGRQNPGFGIFIHGSHVSKGCLAIGNPAIEELFVTAFAMGRRFIEVVIAPKDPRRVPIKAQPDMPAWTQALYDDIATRFDEFHYLNVKQSHGAPKAHRNNVSADSRVILSTAPQLAPIKDRDQSGETKFAITEIEFVNMDSNTSSNVIF
jgi:murein L,D-transpeptidase YafK